MFYIDHQEITVKKEGNKIFFYNEDNRVLAKHIKTIICICNICKTETEINANLLAIKFRRYGSYICNKCGVNKKYLNDDDRKKYYKDKQKKELETKLKNGTTVSQKIQKGEKWGFQNLNQSSGSLIRQKMNQTKQKNNTFGHNGSETRNKMNQTMNENKTDQKTLKRGWYAWSLEDRKKFNELYKPGFLSWSFEERLAHNRKIATNTDIKAREEKRANTCIEKGLWNDPIKLSEWKQYHKRVWRETVRQNLESLENYEKRGRADLVDNAYHLDHQYSIFEGFKNNISPEIIGNIANLKMIPHYENSSKCSKCSLTIEELIAKIK